MRSSGGGWLADAIAENNLTIEVLSDTDADHVVLELASFVEQPNAMFWWDHLRRPTASLHYGATAHPFESGMAALKRLVGDASQVVLLIVGLDKRHSESRPGVDVLRGQLDALVQAIADSYAFEFVVTDEAVTWAVFDTHHDGLVVAGEPPGFLEIDDIRAMLDHEHNGRADR